jgi:hypothetical protein
VLKGILLGLPIMMGCLIMQALLLVAAIRFYRRRDAWLNSPSFWTRIAVLSGVMVLLVVGNLAQVALWAVVFLLLDEFPRFSDAFYHSAVNFATLGYGDIVMSARHKLLGPLEGMNGALMIGLSTAALTGVVQDVTRRASEARSRRDGNRSAEE